MLQTPVLPHQMSIHLARAVITKSNQWSGTQDKACSFLTEGLEHPSMNPVGWWSSLGWMLVSWIPSPQPLLHPKRSQYWALAASHSLPGYTHTGRLQISSGNSKLLCARRFCEQFLLHHMLKHTDVTSWSCYVHIQHVIWSLIIQGL